MHNLIKFQWLPITNIYTDYIALLGQTHKSDIITTIKHRFNEITFMHIVGKNRMADAMSRAKNL